MHVIEGVDVHSIACNDSDMNKTLLLEIEKFQARFPMSDYRFGWLAARNGKLVERLREGGRNWPDTEMRVRAFILSESQRRSTRPARAS